MFSSSEYQYVTERWMYDSSYSISDSIEWLNKRHFDYNGLIERCLAVEASKNIYQRQNPTLISIEEHNAALSNFINSACEWIRDNADVLRTCGSKNVFVEKFRKDIVSKL